MSVNRQRQVNMMPRGPSSAARYLVDAERGRSLSRSSHHSSDSSSAVLVGATPSPELVKPPSPFSYAPSPVPVVGELEQPYVVYESPASISPPYRAYAVGNGHDEDVSPIATSYRRRSPSVASVTDLASQVQATSLEATPSDSQSRIRIGYNVSLRPSRAASPEYYDYSSPQVVTVDAPLTPVVPNSLPPPMPESHSSSQSRWHYPPSEHIQSPTLTPTLPSVLAAPVSNDQGIGCYPNAAPKPIRPVLLTSSSSSSESSVSRTHSPIVAPRRKVSTVKISPHTIAPEPVAIPTAGPFTWPSSQPQPHAPQTQDYYGGWQTASHPSAYPVWGNYTSQSYYGNFDENVPVKPERHPRFWFADGTVVFVAQGTEYRVHQFLLKDMYPMFYQHQPKKMLDQFFSVLYPSEYTEHDCKTAEDWIAILPIACHHPKVLRLAVQQLAKTASAVDKIHLARTSYHAFGKSIDLDVAGAYMELALRKEPFTDAEADKLGLEGVMRVAKVKHELAENLEAYLDKEKVREMVTALL
ncbi:hypothetical protein MIND_01382000 [Mycena indigotica]|uniref:BTB domain-containing protein n=1 Tax=Mycena indigotica TaxID=2126181 RepID=A0A8H6RYV3_9AGAR|nr:uncharacterized protein MIND_01382000 [Mycena indigotica]KAF7289208.1 hypothetical protein MIND_01382000 [Mycena indigotica]